MSVCVGRRRRASALFFASGDSQRRAPLSLALFVNDTNARDDEHHDQKDRQRDARLEAVSAHGLDRPRVPREGAEHRLHLPGVEE